MKKYFSDAALLIIFLLVMSFHFLPRELHEVFGLLMFLAVALHLFFNRTWFKNLRHGKWSARRIFSTLINFSMLITFLTIFVAGICMSNYIFNDFVPLEIRRNITIHQLHVSLPYWLMIFIGLHIGLHWRELWYRFAKNLSLPKFLKPVIILLIIGLGIYGAFLNQVGDRLLMKHIFSTPATETNWAVFLILFLATLGIYSIISYWLNKKFS